MLAWVPDAELPPADRVREQTALHLFPIHDQSAQEWGARNAHELRWFNFHRFRYQDPVLDRWLGDLGAVLSSPAELEAARRRHLTHPERYRIALAGDGPRP